jgi:nucleoside-diphosphate-sugar epimerase
MIKGQRGRLVRPDSRYDNTVHDMAQNVSPATRKLIIGCGYLGTRVAERWLAAGHEVWAMTRSEPRAAEFARQGLRPIVADVLVPESLSRLPAVQSVLYAVGYDRAAGRSIEQVYVDGLRHVLEALPGGVERFIYISSTGVYGSARGEWVDEQTPCQPQRAGGQACLAAEELLNTSRWQRQAIRLRMAGIYGPDRIPRRETLLAGEPIAAPAEGYLNLIHVHDAATVVLAADKRAQPPRLYCVSDGHPAVRREYYECLARLAGAPPPQFIAPPADSPAAQRAEANRRVANTRLLAELGMQLEFPSFREGLQAIVEGESGKGKAESEKRKADGS